MHKYLNYINHVIRSNFDSYEKIIKQCIRQTDSLKLFFLRLELATSRPS